MRDKALASRPSILVQKRDLQQVGKVVSTDGRLQVLSLQNHLHDVLVGHSAVGKLSQGGHLVQHHTIRPVVRHHIKRKRRQYNLVQTGRQVHVHALIVLGTGSNSRVIDRIKGGVMVGGGWQQWMHQKEGIGSSEL